MQIQLPVRVTHTYRQQLEGSVAEVMPLLCPVREAEWANGWEPKLVVSGCGIVERDCVFTTSDPAGGPGAEAIWTVLEYDPLAGIVEMLKVTPGFVVVRLFIALLGAGEDRCTADVTYRYTALGPAGERYVAGRTEAAYAAFMREWEAELNEYLHSSRAQVMGAVA
jgi:hypothetical protein